MVRKVINKNEGIGMIVSELGHVKEYPFVKENDFIIINNNKKIEVYQVEYTTTNNLCCNLVALKCNEWMYSCLPNAVIEYVEELCAA